MTQPTYDWTQNGLTFQQMLEQSNTREGGIYKWARVGGEFRFIRLHWHENHGMLVNDGETATDAGTIMTGNDYWRMSDRYSSTLKVGCSSEAEETLEQLFQAQGRNHRRNW